MSLFGQRLVSLFDTRVEKQNKRQKEQGRADEAKNIAFEQEPWEVNSVAQSEQSLAGPIEKMIRKVKKTDHHSKVQSWINGCADGGSAASIKRNRELDEEEHRGGRPVRECRRSPQDARFSGQSELGSDEEGSHPGSGSEDDSSSVTGDSIFSGGGDAVDVDTEYSVSDAQYPAADQDEEEEDRSDDDISLSDIRSVTDDGYDAGPEEQRVVLWRHVSFHIVRGSKPGQPNTLLAKLSILHTKGEDGKPRVYDPRYPLCLTHFG